MHAKQYRFTLEQLAEAAHVKKTKVYRDIRLGKLDPTNLVNVAAYIQFADTIEKVQAAATPEDKVQQVTAKPADTTAANWT